MEIFFQKKKTANIIEKSTFESITCRRKMIPWVLFTLGKKMSTIILPLSNRENIWSLLSSQSTDHTPSIALHDVKEIETWILRLLSTPVPVPGSTRIECELLSHFHEPMLFALPDHTRFSLVDFPLHLPLELLGI